MGNAERELVEFGDIDELVRHVDRLCAAGDWDALVELHRLCRAALDRGKQLWPVAAQVEYRIALEAPGPFAARMLVAGLGRFALGPLPEVAASTHRWDELAEHAPPGPTASLAAYERVIHGDNLGGDDRVLPVLDVPLSLQWWEPAYPVAEYKPSEASFPMPLLPGLPRTTTAIGPAGSSVDAPLETDALLDLAGAWAAESNGRAEVHAVEGDACAAIAAFGIGEARVLKIDAADALALMAWTAASGGAHGRRRGMATGRFAAWWAAAALGGLEEDWPVPPDELGEAVDQLSWYLWDAGFPDTGWSCRLAVEDLDNRLAWALSAHDTRL